ncbi:hypothetical protein M9Y10_025153 [Tritrichomonas musculus]|uniref:Ankyrin repeat protein n=1 Tax=Tritrichomonas musculus TaxID=1915356 RepID=A0ABR2HAN0_9EUKA
MSPLQFAIDYTPDRIVELFFLHEFQSQSDKIDVNKRSKKRIIGQKGEVFEKTVLYMSIEKNDTNTIKSLLSRADIDINEKSFHYSDDNRIEEKTALHLAVENEDIEIVKLLLEKKEIDINIQDLQGRKPIDCTSDSEIRQLLSQ